MSKLLWIPVGLLALFLILLGGIAEGFCWMFAHVDDWCDDAERALCDWMRKFD